MKYVGDPHLETLGIKEVDDDIWLVSFMDYDLGYVELEQRTLQPLHRPPRAVGQSEQAVLSVSTVDLVTCLAGYTEFPGTNRTLIRRPAGGRRNEGALP
jgi:hypothetical protein